MTVVQLMERKRILFDEVEIDWFVTERQTIVFRKMWKDGYSIFDITKKLKLDMDVVGLMIIEQSILGRIEQRRRGIYEG